MPSRDPCAPSVPKRGSIAAGPRGFILAPHDSRGSQTGDPQERSPAAGRPGGAAPCAGTPAHGAPRRTERKSVVEGTGGSGRVGFGGWRNIQKKNKENRIQNNSIK